MKKVSKNTKVITIGSCLLLLVLTIARNIVNAEEEKPEHKALDMSKVSILEDNDNNGVISKGDLVCIDEVYDKDGNDSEFRVMKTEGNEYTFLDITTYENITHNTKLKATMFGDTYGVSYSGSQQDKWCKMYYDSMPEFLKSAVLEKSIEQSMYQITYGDNEDTKNCIGTYFYMYNNEEMLDKALDSADEFEIDVKRISSITVGPRYVYVPDADDILEYFDNDNEIGDIKEMVKTDRVNQYSALRSAVMNYPNRIMITNNATNNFADTMYINTLVVYPMFVLEIQ